MDRAPAVKVLSIHAGADTGGAGWMLAEGFRRHPQDGIEFRSTVRSSNYIDYPNDLPWHEHATAWDAADAVHLHNNTLTPQRLRPQLDASGKRVVVHYHGTGYRERSQRMLHRQARTMPGAVAAVSTLDLWLLAPNRTTWLPGCVDVEWMQQMRRPASDGVIRVGHAPTNRAIKDTAAFLATCERLPVQVELIEQASWANCLTRKATVDVFYDQVGLGYGVNALEAWAMGIPVIAGGAPDTVAEMRRRFGSLPFVQATAATIGAAIERLLDPVERAHWGQAGLAHVRRWHDHYPVQVAAALYRGRDVPTPS